ncbi:hypothetical protein NW754_015269 [Fusarium falciforme]|nr:hypothetical protein NW754_015269 [Fusarium falciforme]
METYDYDNGAQRTCVTTRHLVYNYYHAGPTSAAAKKIALLLHGHGDYSYGWRYTIPVLLSHDIQCIIPDLLGFGESSKPVNHSMYRLKAMAQDMMEILSHAGVADNEKEHPNFSYWKFFTADGTPSLLREKLPVFWNAAVRGAAETAVPMPELETRLLTGQVPLDWLRKPQIWDDAANENYLHTYWRGGWEAPMNWYKAFLENFEDEKELDPTAIVQTPFLTILGKFDPAIPPEAADMTSSLFARASIKILESGHWVAQEDGVGLGTMIVEWLGAL